jgi:hypothetical protein
MALSELDEISLETYLAGASNRESDKCGAIQVISVIAAAAHRRTGDFSAN